LQARELALKELTAAADGAEGIALDDEDGRIPSVGIATPGSDFILQRLGDANPDGVGRLSLIGKLRQCWKARQQSDHQTNN